MPRLLSEHFVRLPDGAQTPVHIKRLENMLCNHPNQEAVNFIVTGLRDGFSLGCCATITPSFPRNLKSAMQNQDKVSQALLKELRNRHIAGPFFKPPIPNLHCSPIGARLKPDDSVRIILDLSQPTNNSVNGGICKEEYSVQYEPFDVATDMVRRIGRNCYLSKFDIKSAFRLLPVKPSERYMLGMQWLNAYFVDCQLPFGCRSSPFIFSVFSDLLAWILANKDRLTEQTHYLDDFLLGSKGTIEVANSELQTAIRTFSYMNIPLAEDKTVHPTTLTYLGIEIDTVMMQIRLPEDKLNILKQTLPAWRKRKKCTKRELLSLIGTLSFATKVVRPGRTFLRRLIDLSTRVEQLHHHIDINAEAQKDIHWWIIYLEEWNGHSIIVDRNHTYNNNLSLYTDASDVGFGILYKRRWIAQRWPTHILDRLNEFNIDFRELFAIHAAVAMFAYEFEGRKILFITDNLPITQAWQKGTSSSGILMTLIRTILMTAAKNNFTLSLQHIPGVNNTAADLLSRMELVKFKFLMPWCETTATIPPNSIWNWNNQNY